jgi:hypothetical protein
LDFCEEKMAFLIERSRQDFYGGKSFCKNTGSRRHSAETSSELRSHCIAAPPRKQTKAPMCARVLICLSCNGCVVQPVGKAANVGRSTGACVKSKRGGLSRPVSPSRVAFTWFQARIFVCPLL